METKNCIQSIHIYFLISYISNYLSQELVKEMVAADIELMRKDPTA
jgi:hypothetical protein